MRAHENPFRTSRAQALAFRGSLSRAQIVARLAALGYRGAIVGPEGSGKSTLLREIDTHLAAAGMPTTLLQFDDLALLRRVEPSTVLLIDGAEKLPWVLHLVLTLTTARLVVTAHGHREGLPVLAECAATREVLEELVTELAGPDAVLAARARRLFLEKRGNVRQVFKALYDVLAEAG